MVPTRKEDLRKLVTNTTIEMYEELTPQLVQLIRETESNEELTEAQKQNEISLHMMLIISSTIHQIICLWLK